MPCTEVSAVWPVLHEASHSASAGTTVNTHSSPTAIYFTDTQGLQRPGGGRCSACMRKLP